MNYFPEFINLLVAEKLKTPILTTVHAQMTPEVDEVLSCFNKVKNSYLISLSYAHKKLAKKAKIWKVIHNGVDTSLYAFQEKKEDYLFWLGRLSKARDEKGNFLDPKGVRWAIRLARGTGQKLILSGNVEDKKFFEKDVKPYLSKKIQWLGPISGEQPLSKKKVAKLMQNARAFLMTINWYEPFGLVMAEAMSCGTPVIGFDRGSVSELVIDGKTGFVVKPEEGIEGLKKALRKIGHIKPRDCREHVANNFSLEKMVSNYEKAYKEIINKRVKT
jgi:glycosyltransferase involved in cell wall biosynthesis